MFLHWNYKLRLFCFPAKATKSNTAIRFKLIFSSSGKASHFNCRLCILWIRWMFSKHLIYLRNWPMYKVCWKHIWWWCTQCRQYGKILWNNENYHLYLILARYLLESSSFQYIWVNSNLQCVTRYVTFKHFFPCRKKCI